jgi:hypothetical protein
MNRFLIQIAAAIVLSALAGILWPDYVHSLTPVIAAGVLAVGMRKGLGK